MLFADIGSRKLDIRMGQDEIFLRGELLVFCMYLSPDEKTDWIEQSVPFEGRIPCEGAAEEMYYHIQHGLEDTLVDTRLDEDGEMRVLGIEATLNMRINLYEEEETEILEDMYSLEEECVLGKEESVFEELLMQNQSKWNIQVENEQHTDEGIKIEGILHLSFLYLRGDDTEPYGSWQGIMPFSYLIEYPDLPAGAADSLSYYVEQLAVTLAGSEAVEIKAVLAFDVFLRKRIPTEMITEVRTEPFPVENLENRPGIVGHIVQNGEDLWSLAKKYLTTVDGIMEINGMDSENIRQGDKLLIFKENMSIL